MPKPFDTATKFLVEEYPAAWLELLGLAVDGPLEVIDADLSTVQAEADKVLRIGGNVPWIAHLEFQTTYDAQLPGRVLRYNVLLDERHRAPVRSAAILLRPQADGPAMSGEHLRRIPDHDEHLQFRYDVIRVWRISPDHILAGPVGTLPLAPVSDVNLNELPAIVKQMQRRIAAEVDRPAAATLWTTTFLLLGLNHPAEFAQTLLQGVSEMKESSTYQFIVEEGLEKGRTEEARAILLRQGRKQFGDPGQDEIAQLEAIHDLARLEALADRILDVSSWQELLNGGITAETDTDAD